VSGLGRIALPSLDWLNYLPEVGRPFEAEAERWRESERRYLAHIAAAEEVRRSMMEQVTRVHHAVDALWDAEEIARAKERESVEGGAS
jgi:hypothetical protein